MPFSGHSKPAGPSMKPSPQEQSMGDYAQKDLSVLIIKIMI
jgi:hypothetical protein